MSAPSMTRGPNTRLGVLLMRRAGFAVDRQYAKGSAKRRETRAPQCAPDISVVAPVARMLRFFLCPEVVHNKQGVYR